MPFFSTLKSLNDEVSIFFVCCFESPTSPPLLDLLDFFQKFFKVEAAFLLRGNAFFNKPCIRLVKTDFLSNENSAF